MRDDNNSFQLYQGYTQEQVSNQKFNRIENLDMIYLRLP